MEKYGITESMTVAGIISTGVTAVANIDTNQDKKISTLEILNSLQLVAFKVISNIPDFSVLRQEATDYSTEEKVQLAAKIQAEVTMPRAKAEYLVERALSIIIDLIDFAVEVGKPDSEYEEVA